MTGVLLFVLGLLGFIAASNKRASQMVAIGLALMAFLNIASTVMVRDGIRDYTLRAGGLRGVGPAGGGELADYRNRSFLLRGGTRGDRLSDLATSEGSAGRREVRLEFADDIRTRRPENPGAEPRRKPA